MNSIFALDDEQQSAVTNGNRNILVVAAPGSGKTTVIVHRANYLVEHIGEKEESIAVITFTRAAAQNMKSRYIKLTGENSSIFFGTFHSLCYQILKNTFGKVNLIDSKTAINIIGNTLGSYSDYSNTQMVTSILNDIFLYKSKNNDANFKASIDKSIFIKCLKNYDKFKAENNLMDFEDLQINCLKLLVTDKRILDIYRKKFNHILVDEFQDCDETQLRLLKLLNAHASIFAVGDEDQSIYSFRGARPQFMVEFSKCFKDSIKIFLSTNYRCADNIVRCASMLISNNIARNQKDFRAYRKESIEIEVHNCENEAIQAEKILKKFFLNENSDINYNDFAILFRTREESKYLIDAFLIHKVPFRLTEGLFNFYDHPICRDLEAFLNLSVNQFDRDSFIRIINKPSRGISKLELDKVRKYKFQENCFEILENQNYVSTPKLKRLETLRRQINRLDYIENSKKIEYIMSKIGYNKYIKEYSETYNIKIQDIENIIKDFQSTASSFVSTKEFLNHLRNVEDVADNATKIAHNGVLLSTIHGVKGMEFKHVIIINCIEGKLPHEKSLDHNIEEERRLFYVAITRTIESLTLITVENTYSKKRFMSRFIKECNL